MRWCWLTPSVKSACWRMPTFIGSTSALIQQAVASSQHVELLDRDRAGVIHEMKKRARKRVHPSPR